MRRAVLQGVNLQAARLEDADLSDARLDGADLSQAIGLSQAQLDATCLQTGGSAPALPAGLTLAPCR